MPTSTEEINVPQRRRLGLLTAALVIGLVVLGATTYLILFQPQLGEKDSSQARQAYQSALYLSQGGEFSEAVNVTSQAINNLNTSSGVEWSKLRSVLETSKFLGGDREERIEAVSLTKERYTKETSAYNKALQINKLLGYITNAFEQHIIDEVFTGEPFNHLYIAGNRIASIKNLAELSYATYPTTAALFRIALADASPLYGLDVNPLSNSDKQHHAEAILELLKTSESLIENDIKDIRGRPYEEIIPIRYHHWRGLLFGAVSLVKPEYLTQMEDSFGAVFSEYEKHKAADGSYTQNIEASIPYSDFAYASFIYSVGGKSRESDAKQHLDRAVRLIAMHPETHKGSFIALIDRVRSEQCDGCWFNEKRVKQMAAISPSFKNFLNQFGWNL